MTQKNYFWWFWWRDSWWKIDWCKNLLECVSIIKFLVLTILKSWLNYLKNFFSCIKWSTIHRLDIIKKQRRLQKRLAKGIKIFLKMKKEKSNNMIVNDINRPEHEKKRLVEYRKKYLKILKNAILDSYKCILNF